MIDDIIKELGGMSPSPTLDDNDEEKGVVSPEELQKQMESLDPSKEDDDDDNVPVKEEPKADDTKKQKSKTEPEQVKTESVTTTPSDDDEGIELNDDDIPVVVEFFSDKFAEELGWDFGENEKPKSMEELVRYMQNVIDENSKPKYANDEVKGLDEFVSKGGNLRQYLESVYNTEIDLDKADLTKENVQKAVIKENLRSRGYSEQRIDKLIARYEETDALEEEAKDSYEEVKEARATRKQQMLEEQSRQYEDYQKQQKEFVGNIEKIIKDTTEIAGVKLTEADKRELVEYIFKPTADGNTQYQKDYNSNLKNLVESAFFTKKGDKLVQQIEKKAATTATRKLTLKLKTSGRSTKNTASDTDNGGKVSKLWDIASSALNSFE